MGSSQYQRGLRFARYFICMQAGNEVTQLLKRGFFIELQSRYGNIFYVRDEVRSSLPCIHCKSVDL